MRLANVMLLTSALAAPALSKAQTAAAPDVGPKVGEVAPDFTLPASTRAGLTKAVHLADLKGQVVVLAFFPKARTSG
jgi:peroxiredoxin Q/BCP